jgi:hypothetical protein
MSGSAIQAWLSLKQRKALVSAWLYSATTVITGILALLPNLGIAFLFCKLFLLLAVPTIPHEHLGFYSHDPACSNPVRRLHSVRTR